MVVTLAAMLVLLAGGGLAVTVTDLRTEYLENPLGLDRLHPRFQWSLTEPDAGARGLTQQSYRIRVGRPRPRPPQLWQRLGLGCCFSTRPTR